MSSIKMENASLTTLPTELRHEIVKLLIPNTRRCPQIPCCRDHYHESYDDHGWTDGILHPQDHSQLIVPANLSNLITLMSVNKKLNSDVQAVFFSKAVAKFCTHELFNGKPIIEGLGEWHSAYSAPSHLNKRLEHSLQTFTNVILEYHVSKEVVQCVQHLSLAEALRFKFATLDHLRHFVAACNNSRSLRKLQICCNIETEVFAHTGAEGRAVQHALAPFEKLRQAVELVVHVHILPNRQTTWTSQGPIPDQAAQLSQTQVTYVQQIQKSRYLPPLDATNGEIEQMLDDWNMVHTWLFTMLPWLRWAEMVYYPDGCTAQLQGELESGNVSMHHRFKNIVANLWYALNRDDIVSFYICRDRLIDEWEKFTTWGTEALAMSSTWRAL